MKSYLCLTALILLYWTVVVEASQLKCIVAVGACAFNGEDFYSENCEGKKKHFDCLTEHGCSKSDELYVKDYEAQSYDKCDNSGSTAAISWSLSLLSMLMVKLCIH